jgi:hypothetical protein
VNQYNNFKDFMDTRLPIFQGSNRATWRWRMDQHHRR